MSRIAASYARALYDLARESSREGSVGEDLRVVTGGILADRECLEFLTSGVVGRGVKRRLLERLTSTGVEPHVRSLLLLLASRSRLGHLGEVAREYARLEELGRGVRRVTVAAPGPLTDAQRARVTRTLTERMGGTVALETVVEPDLIGGARIECEGVRYELSVDALLRSLARRLKTRK